MKRCVKIEIQINKIDLDQRIIKIEINKREKLISK